MKKLTVLILVVLSCTALYAQFNMPVRSVYSGFSIDTAGKFRIDAEVSILPTSELLNGGCRTSVFLDETVLLYPVFIRIKTGVIALATSVGVFLPDKAVSVLLMPSLFIPAGGGAIDIALSIPAEWSQTLGFRASLEVGVAIN